jgi:hypothetical protein
VNKVARDVLFFAQLLPDLHDLVRKLFEQTSGDLPRARAALKIIGDHGEKLKEWEAELRQRLDEAKERARKREEASK